MTISPTNKRLPGWLMTVLPLAFLGLLVWLFIHFDPLRTLTGDQPPIEDLTIERVEMRPDGILLHVVNGGPEPVTVAQVQVDEAYWAFAMTPSQTIGRLGRAEVAIPYHWVEGELHAVRLITRTGVTFDHEIEVATMTPQPSAHHWWLFAWLGAFVGVVPVALGLMWFPLLGRIGEQGTQFLLALTIGLLVFLLVDTVLEGVEIAHTIPEVFQAVPLIFFAGLLSFMTLVGVGARKHAPDRNTPTGRLWMATSIAVGIGLHNLGEGMAIGASIAIGEAALGTFLVVGFTLHNITEGLGIGVPIARVRPGVGRLAGLALIAGAPAILGTWIGGFAYSPLLAVVFLSIGAGAILQVIYELGRLLVVRTGAPATGWVNLGGITAGLAVMYATAMLVKF